GIWTLSQDVPDDRVSPLKDQQVVGRLTPQLEEALKNPDIAAAAARLLVESEFSPSIAPDVLMAVGLDPDSILSVADDVTSLRRRCGSWASTILTAWDRQCAFCGFDGQLGAATVGVEAAHVRWCTFDGPDDLDNGLALCSLHHKLFDRGVLGLSNDFRILVLASSPAAPPLDSRSTTST